MLLVVSLVPFSLAKITTPNQKLSGKNGSPRSAGPGCFRQGPSGCGATKVIMPEPCQQKQQQWPVVKKYWRLAAWCQRLGASTNVSCRTVPPKSPPGKEALTPAEDRKSGLRRKRHSFLSVSSVCPEPVLVKRSYLVLGTYQNGAKNGAFS